MENRRSTFNDEPLSGWRPWVKGLVKILIIVGVMAGILLAAAGRIDWFAGWLLIVLYLLFLLAIMVWGFRYAPDLMRERGRVASNVKAWDKTINIIYAVLLVVLLSIAGLDAGRYGWSRMPLVLQVLGIMGLVAAGWIIWRTMAENAYLSRWARIQADREQKVIDCGPYRYVRHPMYASIMLLMVCVALELGSWWALIPGVCIGVLFVIRTDLEDRMLHEELEGYCAYASQVRFRLIPGVW